MKRSFRILTAFVLCFIFCFCFACEKNENEVMLKYYVKAEEMIPMLKTGKLSVGLLPEPAVSNLEKIASDKTWYKLDLQELYDDENKAYPQAVLMAKEDLLNSYPETVTYLRNGFDGNLEWVKNNMDVAVSSINSVLSEGITPSLKGGMNKSVVENCKIFWQDASSSKESVKKYINDIITLDGKSAVAVKDDFFYDGSKGESKSFEKIVVACPDGAPSFSIAKYVHDNDNLNTGLQVEYKVVSSDRIGQFLTQGTGEIIICPINLASKLYRAKENYKLVSVLTHGNLYIVSTEKLNVQDLKNKTVGVIGQGLVPDLTLKTVLAKYNIKYGISK